LPKLSDTELVRREWAKIPLDDMKAFWMSMNRIQELMWKHRDGKLDNAGYDTLGQLCPIAIDALNQFCREVRRRRLRSDLQLQDRALAALYDSLEEPLNLILSSERYDFRSWFSKTQVETPSRRLVYSQLMELPSDETFMRVQWAHRDLENALRQRGGF
jgi:hypothetical protein